MKAAIIELAGEESSGPPTPFARMSHERLVREAEELDFALQDALSRLPEADLQRLCFRVDNCALCWARAGGHCSTNDPLCLEA